MDSNFLFLAAAGAKFINGEMKEGFRRRSLNFIYGSHYIGLFMGHSTSDKRTSLLLSMTTAATEKMG